jgi:Aminoglycoside-2''-adenylyltransferase
VTGFTHPTGWGIDALLGKQTRPHHDLDLVVERKDVVGIPAVFPEFAPAEKEWWPARFVLRDRAGRQLDFTPSTSMTSATAGRNYLMARVAVIQSRDSQAAASSPAGLCAASPLSFS